MRVALAGAAAFALGVLLLAAAPSYAQSPPPAQASPPPPLPAPGFMPPYEITRIARAAGFDPLGPPLREGTTYVLRATDFRGILMRVVIDAHSGAIRAVNRIVPGPGPYGAIGIMTPPYGYMPPDYPPPEIAYGPPEVEGPEMAPDEGSLPPPAVHSTARPLVSPPLPRPRPAELAAGKPAEDAKPAVKPGAAPAVAPPAPAAAKKPPPVQLPD